MARITNKEVMRERYNNAWYYALGRLTERGFGNSGSVDDFVDYLRALDDYEVMSKSLAQHFENWSH